MISWPLRLLGWTLGIYALLKLATAADVVTYTDMFQGVLDSLSGIVGLDLFLGPFRAHVIEPTLEIFRGLGLAIPPLQDHWQQVFVLAWLVTGAVARNFRLLEGASIWWGLGLVLAFFVTLPFCVAAGTMPVGSLAVYVWPLAGFFAFGAFTYALNGAWGLALNALAACAGLAALGYFAVGAEGSGRLVLLAAVVGAWGVIFLFSGLILGLRDSEGTLCNAFRTRTRPRG